MRESTIEKAVSKFAVSAGWITYKFTSPQHRGVPDRIFIRDSVVMFVEFKAPGELPTALQAHTHEIMKQHGAVVHVVDSVEQGKALLC